MLYIIELLECRKHGAIYTSSTLINDTHVEELIQHSDPDSGFSLMVWDRGQYTISLDTIKKFFGWFDERCGENYRVVINPVKILDENIF